MWLIIIILTTYIQALSDDFFSKIILKVNEPLYAKSIQMGETIQQNPLTVHILTMIKFTEIKQLQSRNAILINSYMHAREPYSLKLMERLVQSIIHEGEKYQLDYFLKNGVFIFFPFVNADGYQLYIEQATAAKDVRKNMNSNGLKCQRGLPGVDINRNFPSSFGVIAQSSNPCSQQYHGKSPFSQKQALVFKQLFQDFKILIAIDIHSYGNEWIYPYASDSTGLKVKQHALFPFYQSIQKEFKTRNRKVMSCIQSLNYIADGVYIDWALDQGALSFAFEVGTSFHSDSEEDIENDIQRAVEDFYLIFKRTQMNYQAKTTSKALIIKSKSLARMRLEVHVSNRTQQLDLQPRQQAKVDILPNDTHVTIINIQTGEKQVISLKLRGINLKMDSFTIICLILILLGGLLFSFYTRWQRLRRIPIPNPHSSISLEEMPTIQE